MAMSRYQENSEYSGGGGGGGCNRCEFTVFKFLSQSVFYNAIAIMCYKFHCKIGLVQSVVSYFSFYNGQAKEAETSYIEHK